MFCSKCGAKLADNSSFCSACGVATTSAPTGNPGADASREGQKDYEQVTSHEVTCLECGYEGIMGISEKYIVKGWLIKGVILSVLEYIAASVILTRFMPSFVAFIIAGIVISITWTRLKRKYWICPSCKEMLRPK